MVGKCCLREIPVFYDKESIFFTEKSNENETLYSGKRSEGQKWILMNFLSFIQILIFFSCFYFHSFLSHFSSCQLHHLWPSHSLIIFFQFICCFLWQHQTHFISLFFTCYLLPQNKLPYLWKIYTNSYFLNCFWIVTLCLGSYDLHLWQ